MSAVSSKNGIVIAALCKLVNAANNEDVLKPIVENINKDLADVKFTDQQIKRFNLVCKTISDVRWQKIDATTLGKRCKRWDDDKLFSSVAAQLRTKVPLMPTSVAVPQASGVDVKSPVASASASAVFGKRPLELDANPGVDKVITRDGDKFIWKGSTPPDALSRLAAGGGLIYVDAKDVEQQYLLDAKNLSSSETICNAILGFEKVLHDSKIIAKDGGPTVEDVLLTACSSVTTGLAMDSLRGLNLRSASEVGAPDEFNSPNQCKVTLTPQGMQLVAQPPHDANPRCQSWRIEVPVPYISAATLTATTKVPVHADFIPINVEAFRQSHASLIRDDVAAVLKTARKTEWLTRRSTRLYRAIAQADALQKRVAKLLDSAPSHLGPKLSGELAQLALETATIVKKQLKRDGSINKHREIDKVIHAAQTCLRCVLVTSDAKIHQEAAATFCERLRTAINHKPNDKQFDNDVTRNHFIIGDRKFSLPPEPGAAQNMSIAKDAHAKRVKNALRTECEKVANRRNFDSKEMQVAFVTKFLEGVCRVANQEIGNAGILATTQYFVDRLGERYMIAQGLEKAGQLACITVRATEDGGILVERVSTDAPTAMVPQTPRNPVTRRLDATQSERQITGSVILRPGVDGSAEVGNCDLQVKLHLVDLVAVAK
jgi:hypothetical protein